MARYGKEHKEQTRGRIVETSGRRFKIDGVNASGIATLMADAGLTNGAFYAHFASKDAVVARVVVCSVSSTSSRHGSNPTTRPRRASAPSRRSRGWSGRCSWPAL